MKPHWPRGFARVMVSLSMDQSNNKRNYGFQGGENEINNYIIQGGEGGLRRVIWALLLCSGGGSILSWGCGITSILIICVVLCGSSLWRWHTQQDQGLCEAVQWVFLTAILKPIWNFLNTIPRNWTVVCIWLWLYVLCAFFDDWLAHRHHEECRANEPEPSESWLDWGRGQAKYWVATVTIDYTKPNYCGPMETGMYVLNFLKSTIFSEVYGGGCALLISVAHNFLPKEIVYMLLMWCRPNQPLGVPFQPFLEDTRRTRKFQRLSQEHSSLSLDGKHSTQQHGSVLRQPRLRKSNSRP